MLLKRVDRRLDLRSDPSESHSSGRFLGRRNLSTACERTAFGLKTTTDRCAIARIATVELALVKESLEIGRRQAKPHAWSRPSSSVSCNMRSAKYSDASLFQRVSSENSAVSCLSDLLASNGHHEQGILRFMTRRSGIWRSLRRGFIWFGSRRFVAAGNPIFVIPTRSAGTPFPFRR